MGMPACRISDLTAHGGTIVEGFPQVLIGDLPASRIGDMHECPMVTPGVPPIPHVGGPFILGSPTVLVGEMPQSRVTDQLVCVGPPDEAVLGEMTVLVGMAGGAGAVAAEEGLAAMGIPAPPFASSSAAASGGVSGSASAQTKSMRQPDGSIQTLSTTPGKSLPPIELKQPGWPDLPPENTATFSSVQPATIQPGTQVFAPVSESQTANSYWSTVPPTPETVSSSTALPPSTHIAVLTAASPQGLRVWAGHGVSDLPGLQVWMPPAAAAEGGTQKRFFLNGPPVRGGVGR